jgi:flagellar hook-associated protein 3 FlgL
MVPIKGSTEQYLDNLDRIQSTLTTIQRQISSGVRVGTASDDPDAVAGILGTVSAMAMNDQLQTNLNRVKAELQSGDSALQQAVKLVEQAISIGTQGASGATDASQLSTLAQQAQGLQESLVALTATSVNGRYIFSGDLDQQPLYALDASQPAGVRQLAAAKSTMVVTDGQGTTLWTPQTAADIFDARNADGSVKSGNVFAAVNSLITALQGGDHQGAQTAVDALKTAEDHVNLQLGLLGIAENRVADTQDAAARSVVQEKQDLSSMRDTDIAAAAIQLSQTTLQQQAALSAGARIAPLSLFDFLA